MEKINNHKVKVKKRLENNKKYHPIGLYYLFFTEMWERFSFYGMRAILTFYMIKQLHFEQSFSSHIYGLYTGFVYFTPIFGGMIADYYLGQRRTVIIGGILMAIGHFLMAFESLFYSALFFLILGNGAFKPNISSQVGAMYPVGDIRRDRAFSIFYFGINVGAFLAPLICGTLGECYGWHYGFGVAGIGMIAGLIVYICGKNYLPVDHKISPQQKINIFAKENPEWRKSVLGMSFIFVVMIFFWTVYEQQGNTLALWIDRYTDRHLGFWEIPASWFQSCNPVAIILLTPLVIEIWNWQKKRGNEPSGITKLAIGFIFAGLSYLILMWAAKTLINVNGEITKISSLWFWAFVIVITLGELYICPVCMSLVTKLAPSGMTAIFMGTWLMTSFIGNYLAGFLGTFWETMPKDSFFLMMSLIPFITATAILIVRKPLKKKIQL